MNIEPDPIDRVIEVVKDKNVWVAHGNYNHLITADIHVTEKYGYDASIDIQSFRWVWIKRGWLRAFDQIVWLDYHHYTDSWTENLIDQGKRLDRLSNGKQDANSVPGPAAS